MLRLHLLGVFCLFFFFCVFVGGSFIFPMLLGGYVRPAWCPKRPTGTKKLSAVCLPKTIQEKHGRCPKKKVEA